MHKVEWYLLNAVNKEEYLYNAIDSLYNYNDKIYVKLYRGHPLQDIQEEFV